MTNLYDQMTSAIAALDHGSARSGQSRDGILGPSDIGFCRQKAKYVTEQVQPTDDKSMWAAQVGTAIHNYVEEAFKIAHPDWICGSIDHLQTETMLPSGAVITGHPDVVMPEHNTIIDIKTVDGFTWTAKNGPSLSHRYQRHLYALGLLQAGILQPEGLMVGNLYFDRSGKERDPLLFITEYEDELTHEIDEWIGDVIYAVKHGEDTARDVAPAVCSQICEFYTVCRGGSLPSDINQVIEFPDQIKAIDMYVEGKRLEKEGKDMKEAAKDVLAGVNGSDGRYQVRWVDVAGYDYPAGSRAGSTRLDIKPLRKG